MYVKNRMTKHPICIDVNSKISDVVDIMSEKELHRIPVVSGKKLVGLVTEGMISKKGASKATSLSIYELNYLLSKTSVDARCNYDSRGSFSGGCGTADVQA